MIKVKGNTVTMLADFTGKPGKKVMRVKDNGNGFTVKIYSWSSCEPNIFLNIGYSDAADLVDCLEYMDYR